MQMNSDASIITVYAAYQKNDSIRMVSSSGGIFTLFAQQIIQKGGVVYGVAMSEDCYSSCYCRVTTEDKLSLLRGSKYFQASTGDTYKKVKRDLEYKIPVLFSGTGCQINGLKKYLGKEYENLFCVDVICHGVPSPALWREYAKYREKENGGKLTNINFRCKDDSWVDFGMKETHINSKQLYISKDKDPFMMMFLRNYCLRPSCYTCAARTVRHSDVTLADFWGIGEIAPEMDDGKGTSLVLIRTKKGQKFFNNLKNNIEWREVTYEDGVRRNTSEYKSPLRPPQRDLFFSDMKALSFHEMEQKYASSRARPFKRKVKSVIKKIVKILSIGGV